MRQKNLNTVFQNSLLIAWCILCVVLFILFPGRANYMQWVSIENPFHFIESLAGIPISFYLFEFIRSLGGVVIFTVCSTALGMFITKSGNIFQPTSEEFYLKIAKITTQFLIGQSVFSLIFLACATLSRLTPVLIAATLLLGFLLGFRQITSTTTNPVSQGKFNGTAKLIFVLSAIVIAVTVLQSSSRISYDSTAIYFSDAKLTAITQRASYFTDDTFVASVLQSTIQYAAIMQVFGEQSARMFSWICGVVIAIFSLALGKRMGLSNNALVILLALVSSSTAFLDLMGDGKVDLISSTFAISAVYWMNVEIKGNKPDRCLLLLIGYLTGFACITRPFNVFLMGILVVFFYLQNTFKEKNFNSARFKLFASVLTWVGIGAIGPGIYHIILNWALLGNPIAFVSSVSRINPSAGPWDFDPNTIFLARLFYPLVVTFKNNPQSLGNISPLFIAFLPAIGMKRIRNNLVFSKEFKQLLFASIFTLVLWIISFFTIVEIRYVFFLWLILYMPVAEITAMIWTDENRLVRNTVSGLVITTLSFMLLRSINISFSGYSYIDNAGAPQCSDTPFCEYLKPINEQANQGDRVLTLGAYRYYLRPDLFTCSTNHSEYAALHDLSYKNMDAFWLEVYRLGYKFIAYEKDYTVRHLQFGAIPGPQNTPQWIILKPLYDKFPSELMVYQIQVKNPPIESEVFCKRGLEKIWVVK